MERLSNIISLIKSKKLALLLLIILIILKILFIYHSDMTGDEYKHYFMAKYILEHGELFYGKEIFPHIIDTYMPLYHIVLSGFMFFIQSANILRYISIIWMLITTYFLYKLFYPYDQTGILAVISNFNYVVFFPRSTGLWSETFFLMLTTIAIYFYIKDKNAWIIFFIFSLLTKHYLGLSLLAVFLFNSWQTKKYRKLLIAILITIPYIYASTMIVPSSPEIFGYHGLFIYKITEFQQLYALIFLPFILISFFALKKEDLIFWVAGVSFALPYLIESIVITYFIPSAIFTFLLFYLFLKRIDFKYIKHFFIILIIANLGLSFYYNNFNCPLFPMFENLYFWDNFNCLNPYFKESLPFIRENITKDSIIFTPFPFEIYYWASIPTTNNQNMMLNNATHVFIMKEWLQAGFFYDRVTPDIRTWNSTVWNLVYENQRVAIINRNNLSVV